MEEIALVFGVCRDCATVYIESRNFCPKCGKPLESVKVRGEIGDERLPHSPMDEKEQE